MLKLITRIKGESEILSEYLKKTDPRTDNLLTKTLDYIEKTVGDVKDEDLQKAKELTEILIESTETDRYTVPAAFMYGFFDNLNNNGIPKTKFNDLVYGIAESISKFPDITKLNFTDESDNFIKLLLTVMGDVRAVIIRLIEQLRRTRNAINRTETYRKMIAEQNFAVFAPAAHRIGLYGIKTELENLSLLFKKAEDYQSIRKKLDGTKKGRELYIQQFLKPLKDSLDTAGIEYNIKWRTKSIFSIWNKMKNKDVPFEEVFDLFAVRIIIDSDIKNEKAECWQVYSLITQIYRPDTSRLRDWISFPKSSGYESLHTTVFGENKRPVEVQIRTARMDEIAEKGPAAHWKYKGIQKGNTSLWLEKMRNAIENPDIEDNPEHINNIKAGNESNEIFVLTPKGDALSLRAGYTIIDLAFSIHTKIGETCTGAIVNGKIQPASYIPKNGDTIKILTDKNKKPGRDWLRIAQSPRSKAKIKRALKLTLFDQADKGKEILKSKLLQLKLEFSDNAIQKLREEGGFDSSLEMFHAYATAKADIKNIKAALLHKPKDPKKEEVIPSEIEQKVDKVLQSRSDDFLLIDQNLSTIDYTLSKCCNPLPGDKIFGFVTVSKGTKIHKNICPNAKDLKTRYPYRVVPAKWNTKVKTGEFIAEIGIKGNDKTGMVSVISQIITDEFELKIKAISLKAKQHNSFLGTIALNVRSRAQLNELMISLRKIDGVTNVREKH